MTLIFKRWLIHYLLGMLALYLCYYALLRWAFSGIEDDIGVPLLSWVFISFMPLSFIMRFSSTHPVADAGYAAWLRQTPWRYPRMPPNGPACGHWSDLIIMASFLLMGLLTGIPPLLLVMVPLTMAAAFFIWANILLSKCILRGGPFHSLWMIHLALAGLIILTLSPLNTRELTHSLLHGAWPAALTRPVLVFALAAAYSQFCLCMTMKHNAWLGSSLGACDIYVQWMSALFPNYNRGGTLGNPLNMIGPVRLPRRLSAAQLACLGALFTWLLFVGLSIFRSKPAFSTPLDHDPTSFHPLALTGFALALGFTCFRLAGFVQSNLPPLGWRHRIFGLRPIIPRYDYMIVLLLLPGSAQFALPHLLHALSVPIFWNWLLTIPVSCAIGALAPPRYFPWHLTSYSRLTRRLPTSAANRSSTQLTRIG